MYDPENGYQWFVDSTLLVGAIRCLFILSKSVPRVVSMVLAVPQVQLAPMREMEVLSFKWEDLATPPMCMTDLFQRQMVLIGSMINSFTSALAPIPTTPMLTLF